MESELKDSSTSIPIAILPLLSWIVQWILNSLQYVLFYIMNQYEEIERIHRTCVFIMSLFLTVRNKKTIQFTGIDT